MRNFFKFLLYLVIILAAIIGIVYFGSEPIIKNIVDEKLQEKKIAGIYQLHYKNAYINLLQMGITITDIELIPDSSIASKKLYKYQKNIAHLHIKRLTLSNIDILELINEKKVIVSSIKVINPQLNYYKNNKYVGKPPVIENETDEIELKKINLDKIIVRGLSINYFIDEDKKADLTIGKTKISLTHPIIDMTMITHPLDAISLDDMQINIKDIKYQDDKGLYDFHVKDAEYVYKEHQFILKNIKVKPNYNKKQFAAKHPYQSDRMDASISQLTIAGLNFKKLIRQNIIAISDVNIESLKLEVYRDKNYPTNNKKLPKLPQQALRATKQKMEIENINIKNSHVVYLEKEEGKTAIGKVEFKEIQAKLHYLGNTKSWQKSKKLQVNIQALLYGKGKMNVDLDFPLSSSTFYFSGQVYKMPMSAFNKMSDPSAGVQINKGNLEKIEFQAKANNISAKGNLSFYYSDLDISIHKKKKKSGEIKDAKFFSFLANSIFLPKSNPNKKGVFYVSTIEFERDQHKSIFNYLWKSIFSGLKDTLLKKHKKDQKKKK
ncbi:MAG: DUF748 domain-containing protein [Bacteroidales bacterium]|nr:DUF748 domain-containing protein [Bacteroidales bacterium]